MSLRPHEYVGSAQAPYEFELALKAGDQIEGAAAPFPPLTVLSATVGPATPPKLAPYPTLVGTAITGRDTNPATTLGSFLPSWILWNMTLKSSVLPLFGSTLPGLWQVTHRRGSWRGPP